MKVTEIADNEYAVEIDDEEFVHLSAIAINSKNTTIIDIASLIRFILTRTEQHWYETLDEPAIADFEFPGKEPNHGHPSTP